MSLPAWVEVTSALLTPAIAVVGSFLAYQNHQLAKQRRKDELFDRRYEFYQRARNAWLTASLSLSDQDFETELLFLSQEAEFLFGKDIADHIRSLGKRYSYPEYDIEPDDTVFAKPFSKYLRLEDK